MPRGSAVAAGRAGFTRRRATVSLPSVSRLATIAGLTAASVLVLLTGLPAASERPPFWSASVFVCRPSPPHPLLTLRDRVAAHTAAAAQSKDNGPE